VFVLNQILYICKYVEYLNNVQRGWFELFFCLSFCHWFQLFLLHCKLELSMLGVFKFSLLTVGTINECISFHFERGEKLESMLSRKETITLTQNNNNNNNNLNPSLDCNVHQTNDRCSSLIESR